MLVIFTGSCQAALGKEYLSLSTGGKASTFPSTPLTFPRQDELNPAIVWCCSSQAKHIRLLLTILLTQISGKPLSKNLVLNQKSLLESIRLEF
jgi:hypothetical protein